jgi:hypothetical protein
VLIERAYLNEREEVDDFNRHPLDIAVGWVKVFVEQTGKNCHISQVILMNTPPFYNHLQILGWVRKHAYIF